MASKSHQIRSIDCDGLRIAASVEVFEDLAHFSRSFKQAFGYPPSEARRRVQWSESSGQLN